MSPDTDLSSRFALDVGSVEALKRQARSEPDKALRETVDREVRGVRNALGFCDVSTLGKIDVQGPDAGAFLDRVYANSFSNLPVGKAGYGVMLREDGFVLEDGTAAARLSN